MQGRIGFRACFLFLGQLDQPLQTSEVPRLQEGIVKHGSERRAHREGQAEVNAVFDEFLQDEKKR